MANLNDYGSLDIASADEWSGERKPVPEGEYAVTVVASEVKDTRAGDKRYVSVEYSIIDGEYRKRRIFDSFFLWVQSRVPLSKYKSLRIACGLNGNILGDTDDLLGRELLVGVGIEEQEGYKPRNRVTVYKPLRAAAAPASTAQPATRARASSRPRPAAAPQPAPVAESIASETYPWVGDDEA